MKTMTNTMLSKVVGAYSDGEGYSMVNVTMRFSSDGIGETLSLEAMGRQITVPFEAVIKLVKATWKKAEAGE